MSLSGAVFIGMSGMDAYTQGLQTISNNVANLNTVGFKEQTTPFVDMFNVSGGEMDFGQLTDEQPQGNGVQFGSPQLDFGQGTLEQTNGNLDLAIQGAGFLVLLNGSSTSYTRSGSFAVDTNGNITEQGTTLQLGVINSAGQIAPLNVSQLQTSAAAATTKVTFSNNLSSSATSDTVSNINVFDSNGGQHTWTVALAASTSTPGQWTATVTDQTGATVGTGTIDFKGSTIDPANATLTINTTPTNAAPLSVTLDFSSVTSFSSGSSSTLQATNVDGNAAGTLTGVSVTATGHIQLSYSNSKTQLEGSVALANFLDPQQLHEATGGRFENTAGAPVEISTSGQNGFGTLVSGQLETSNVNLTQQFSDLILIQRGFQASSEVVSVANDMIQNLFGIRGHG